MFVLSVIVVTTRDGQERRLYAHLGISIMEIIRDAGVDEPMALCGTSAGAVSLVFQLAV